MSPAEEERVVRRAARVLRLQHDPSRRLGYRDHSYQGPTVDEVLVEAVGEPDSFDHPYWGLAKRALQQAGQRSPRHGPRQTAPDKQTPGPEFHLDGARQLARRV